jgi:hypothetical protein
MAPLAPLGCGNAGSVALKLPDVRVRGPLAKVLVPFTQLYEAV